MSLHSSAAKVGTTEFLSQPVKRTTFQTTEPSRVQTTVVQTTPSTIKEVKTVTTEVSRQAEGVSAGEIPKTTTYTDPSTQIRGGQFITDIKGEPIPITTSQVYGGGVTGSQAYRGVITPYQVYGGEVPIATELKEYGHGNIVFRPIEARFHRNDGYGEMMNPYCKAKIGFHRQKGSISKTGGVDVVWNDLIKLERKHKQHYAKVKCKDKNRVNMHGNLGYCNVDLNEVAEKGKICGWFPLHHSQNDNKITGELLLEVQDLSAIGPAI